LLRDNDAFSPLGPEIGGGSIQIPICVRSEPGKTVHRIKGEVRDLGYLEILTDRLNNQIYYLNSPTPWGIIQLSIFTDCSGGNSSPSHPADAGGCTF
jgi:hypothetical protein